jgi:hypothetical protein
MSSFRDQVYAALAAHPDNDEALRLQMASISRTPRRDFQKHLESDFRFIAEIEDAVRRGKKTLPEAILDASQRRGLSYDQGVNRYQLRISTKRRRAVIALLESNKYPTTRCEKRDP